MRIITVIVAFLAGVGTGVGGVFVWPHLTEQPEPPPPMVQRVRIELQKYVDADVKGSRLNVPKRPNLVNFDTPDYYLELHLRGNIILKTEPHIDTPIGNGLEWYLAAPVQLADIHEVRVFDAGLMSDTLIDRVNVRQRRYEEGQLFNFHLLEDVPLSAQPRTPPVEEPREQNTAATPSANLPPIPQP